jgi:hypothetical protein
MSILLFNYLNLQNTSTFPSFSLTSSVRSRNYAALLAAVWNSGTGKFADAVKVLYFIQKIKENIRS